MTEQATLFSINDKLDNAGVTVDHLGNIDLFDIVLDLIGFPEESRPVCQINSCGEEIDCMARSKWGILAFCAKKEEIDDLIEKLHAEYNELLLEQRGLFEENTDDIED